jgi:FeS assembly SUF system regulator
MIRITKMTDYGILLLSRFATGPEATRTVRDLAAGAHLPEPTVGKLLKALTKSGLLVSTRGVKGGYRLARRPQEITVAQIISAIDGPIAITDCATSDALHPSRCELEGRCPVQTNWQKINVAIRDSLERITLADMAGPMPGAFVPLSMIGDTASPQRTQRTQRVAEKAIEIGV